MTFKANLYKKAKVTMPLVTSRFGTELKAAMFPVTLIIVGLTMIVSRKPLGIITIVLLLILMSACSSKPSQPQGPAAAVQTHSYEAVGTVKGIDPKLPSIEIDHGEIPGLMPAMQMDFHVKDRSLIEGLAVGDKIKFTVENGVGGLKVTAIQKL